MTERRICLVFGTRPEAIKVGPVAAELRALGHDPVVLCSGQHTSLLRGTPAESDLAEAISLHLPSHDDPLEWLEQAVPMFRVALRQAKPAVVAVQGDTMTALAAARASGTTKLAHIEAGVRSGDPMEPWPEEVTRSEIDILSGLHLAPTLAAAENLYREGYQRTVEVTGNTVVSALARYSGAKPRSEASATILVTLHRREFRARSDCRDLISTLFDAAAASECGFLWPVHPGMTGVLPDTPPPPNFLLVPPYAYRDCIEILAGCRGVLTDSGGLVEEAACLGVPTAIFRNRNDRPEAEAAGVAVRYDVNADGIVAAVTLLSRRMLPRQATAVFGTVTAAGQVAEALLRWASR